MITKGQKINERYEIIRSIGEGGMANVYLAKDIILDRNVAIKILRGDLAGDEKFVRRFQREALSASSLSHPNIVEMYDVGEDSGTYYIVMEYVEGMTLKQMIKKKGALSLSEAIDIMLQITDGIKEAHDSYIIHRDLKPQNILIQENGEIKITDFGIAMALNSTQLTQTNSVMGSVHYLPPEQASGKGATIKSDIYSMGILFYELLTGKLPFKGENAVEIALKHMKNDIPSVRSDNPSIPQSVENIILKATAKNPKNRYESAKEMHEDLLTCLNKERLNEPKYEFLYPEHDGDENRKVTLLESGTIEDNKVEPENILGEEESKNTWIWILASIFIFIVLVLIGIFIVYPKLTEVPDVVIPNVAGMTIQKAEETLKAKGFKVAIEVRQVSDENIEAGLVAKTSPSIGRKIKKGTEIYLYESLGDTIYTIEDYKGRNYIEVQTILKNQYGLNVTIEKIDIKEGEEYGDQEIIKQDVEPGTRVSKGSKITLYIPNVVDEYPDFVDENWSIEEINNFCTEYGINVTFVPVQSEEYPENTIISQSRAPKTPIVRGATLKIEYAVKKQDITTSTDGNTNNNNSNNNNSSSSNNNSSNSSTNRTN